MLIVMPPFATPNQQQDAFHHHLAEGVHHRNRNPFLVHIQADIFGAGHKGTTVRKQLESNNGIECWVNEPVLSKVKVLRILDYIAATRSVLERGTRLSV